MKILTIGHSTRSFEEFLELLEDFQIQGIIDIRRYPSSRKFPQFNSEPMRRSLSKEGIDYIWLEALGGRRHGVQGTASPNSGLKSPGFRSYADHMLTEEFRSGVEKVLFLASEQRIAVMCAERLYFRCHRFLLSDYLHAQGVEVKHIIDAGQIRPHRLTSIAVVRENGTVIYPAVPA
jgi:uncharacterized protein (DUF488 family)